MITDRDIEKLKKVFVTRDEFNGSILELIRRMGEMKDEIKTELRQELRDELLTLKDYMVGEFSAIRQELALLNGHSDILEDHETRIKRLERKKTN